MIRLSVATLAFLALSTPALADLITYTVDPARSSLTISGTGHSLPIWPVTSSVGGIGSGTGTSTASFTTSYSGTISADRDLLLDTLQIVGGTISAQNSGDYSPLALAPANYGMFVSTSSRPGFGVFAAILNLSFVLTSTLITTPSSFDASLLSTSIASGQIDFARTVFHDVSTTSTSGSSPITGSPSLADGLASLTSVGDTEILSIPVEMDFLAVEPYDTFALHFSGTIVATAPIPEPTTLIVALPATLLLLRRQRDKQGANP